MKQHLYSDTDRYYALMVERDTLINGYGEIAYMEGEDAVIYRPMRKEKSELDSFSPDDQWKRQG